MNRRPTIDDVAESAGVSISTVSRVLNGTAPVAADTLRRVEEAIIALDYHPHSAARILASRRTKTIGLLLPEISGSFFPPMLRGIERGIRERGYDLLIHTAPRPADQESQPLRIGEHNTDGLLIFTDSLAEDHIRRMAALGFPLVLLHRSPPQGLQVPCVTFENKNGARKLVEYLITERGYNRIGFLRGPSNNEDSYWREAGYREALQRQGIPWRDELIGYGGFRGSQAARTVGKWLDDGLQLDAIFAADDDSAVGAIRATHQKGLRVPEDLAVAGFDDVPLSQYLTPPLTTVRAPIEQAGYQAAQQLTNLIENGTAEELILLPTQLVVRRSCGNPYPTFREAPIDAVSSKIT